MGRWRTSALAFAQPGTNGHEVNGVADAVKVVLLDLEPLVRALGCLVLGVDLQRLHHQPLAVPDDRLLQEVEDLFRLREVFVGSELEETIHSLVHKERQGKNRRSAFRHRREIAAIKNGP